MATFFTPKSRKATNGSLQKALDVTIDAHDHAGNGLCLSSHPITVVSNALLGETCRVKFTKQTKRVNFAQTTKVLMPSAQRTKPFCAYYDTCGGCSLQHTSAQHGLTLKQQALKDFVSKKLDLPAEFNGEHIWQAPVLSNIDYTNTNTGVNTGYRRRIRLAIDARNKKNIKIGFRAQGSDAIIDIPSCAVATPGINSALVALRQACVHLLSIQKIGHIVITQGALVLQIGIFTSQGLCKKSIAKLSELANLSSCEVVIIQKGAADICLTPNAHDGITQQILSKESSSQESSSQDSVHNTINKFAQHDTSALVIEDIKGVALRIHSAHFLQVNKGVNQGMLALASKWLAADKTHTLYDFYCGAGNFALSFAPYVDKVQGYEGVQDMVEVAKTNATNTGFANCTFSTQDLANPEALNALSFNQNALVILDPSREGALALCQYLASCGVQKILYVSCNPNSFVRDAQYLLPTYSINKIVALDMFPFTKHIELMALFSLR